MSTEINRHLHVVDAVAERLTPELRQRFGCCFDPGNMPDSPERKRWWRELAQRANHYHLKAVDNVAAGQGGALPHVDLFALLHEVGYEGFVTIEFAGDGDPAAGIEQCARLFHKSAFSSKVKAR